MDRKRTLQENNIPDELVEEILVRLPIKTLVRLLCVSKPWKSLISSSSFVAEYQNRHPKPSLISSYVLLQRMEFYARKQPDDRVAFRYFPFRKRRQKGRLSFLDAINGVVCLVSACSSRTVILFNPTIRHYVEIPDSTLLHEVLDDTFSLGFGFEDGGFKVVRFGNPLDKIVYEVFSTNKGTWRKGIGSETIQITEVASRNSLFMNGIVHWVVLTYDSVENCHGLELLMFDCKGEDFTSVKLPRRIDHVTGSWGEIVLCKFREKLSIISHNGEEFELWVMEGYGFAGYWKNQNQELKWSTRIDLVLEETLFLMDSPKAKPISARDIEVHVDQHMLRFSYECN